MIRNAFAAAHDAIGTPSMDLPECGAMSQGYIGYHLQQGIGREMHRRYKRWHAATSSPRSSDPDDPAFKNPTKPIGPFYTEEQAKQIMAEDPEMIFVEDSGRGWRRVVASPEPKKIVEADSILNLLDNEFIVIACGGGGIPVVRDYANKGCYKGVPAVIDKDLGGELLAEDCSADVLFLLTAVEHVAINFGKPDQQELEELTADEAERLADEGQFGKGSMEPKVRAAIKFAPLPQGPHLHHRRPGQGRRDHGWPFWHPHHGLVSPMRWGGGYTSPAPLFFGWILCRRQHSASLWRKGHPQHISISERPGSERVLLLLRNHVRLGVHGSGVCIGMYVPRLASNKLLDGLGLLFL